MDIKTIKPLPSESTLTLKNIWAWTIFQGSDGQFSREKVYFVWTVFHIMGFILVNAFLEKTFFPFDRVDAFFNQMDYVALRMSYGELDDLLSPMSAPIGFFGVVHFFRFLAISPFYLSRFEFFPPIFDTLCILVFLLPILFARLQDRPRSFLQPFLVYLPFFFSFRTVMAMCGIAYLFLFIYGRRNQVLTFISIFLVNTSSGVVLLWLMILMTQLKKIHSKGLYVVLGSFFILSLSFSCSLVEKYGSFKYKTHVRIGESQSNTVSLLELSETIAVRSTFSASLLQNEIGRPLFYFGLFSIVVGAAVISIRRSNNVPGSMKWVFICFMPMFLVEGLAAVSSLIVLILFYLYFFRPVWRLQLENRIRRMLCFPESGKKSRQSH